MSAISTTKTNQKPSPPSHGLDEVIAFDNGVDCTFFALIVTAAMKYHKARGKACDIPTTEALRRAIALIEAIFKDDITITETR